MKRLALVITMCSSYLYSMEAELTSATYTYGNTNINLVKGNIEDFDGKAAVIVLGNEKIESSYFWDHSKSIIISGREPELYLSNDRQSVLCCHRYLYPSLDDTVRIHQFYQGNEAIKRVEKELYAIYQKALIYGNLEKIRKNNPEKSIAMSLLSLKHFPKDKAAKCAVSAIIDRIRNYPGDYDIMYIVMNSDSDIDECKKLLAGYIR